MDDITNFKSYIQSSSKAIPTKNKREEDRNTKIWISQEKKSLLDKIKSIFHNYLRAMLWFGQKNEKKRAQVVMKKHATQPIFHWNNLESYDNPLQLSIVFLR